MKNNGNCGLSSIAVVVDPIEEFKAYDKLPKFIRALLQDANVDISAIAVLNAYDHDDPWPVVHGIASAGSGILNTEAIT